MSDASSPLMVPRTLMIRCLSEKRDGQWQAVSLEFGLAAQADSEADAKRKLEDMVRSYVYDALVGEDKEHADVLLSRRAPMSAFVKYYGALALSHLGVWGRGRNGSYHGAYRKPLPMKPADCPA